MCFRSSHSRMKVQFLSGPMILPYTWSTTVGHGWKPSSGAGVGAVGTVGTACCYQATALP